MNDLAFAITIAVLVIAAPPYPVAHSVDDYKLSPHQVIVKEMPPVMLKIALAESGLNPAAKSPTSSAKGLFQILDGTWKYMKCAGDVYNPYDNIACAAKLYAASGTKPWNASKAKWGR